MPTIPSRAACSQPRALPMVCRRFALDGISRFDAKSSYAPRRRHHFTPASTVLARQPRLFLMPDAASRHIGRLYHASPSLQATISAS